MPTFDLTKPEESEGGEWTPLATGEYVMKIAEAQVAKNPFPNDDGEFDDQLKITWELAEWNPDYEAAGYQQRQKVFWQMRPWYGSGKRGDSKFKAFIDDLKRQELIKNINDMYIAGEKEAPNQGDLIGITQRVMVEYYVKTMGKNAGQPGNRVLAVAPPRKSSPTPATSQTNGDTESDYHAQLYDQFKAGDFDDNLAELAGEFAAATDNPMWTRKKFGERNPEQLKMDIMSMWAYIQRHRKEAITGTLEF